MKLVCFAVQFHLYAKKVRCGYNFGCNKINLRLLYQTITNVDEMIVNDNN